MKWRKDEVTAWTLTSPPFVVPGTKYGPFVSENLDPLGLYSICCQKKGTNLTRSSPGFLGAVEGEVIPHKVQQVTGSEKEKERERKREPSVNNSQTWTTCSQLSTVHFLTPIFLTTPTWWFGKLRNWGIKRGKKGRKGQTIFFPIGYWSAASPGWKSEVSVTGTFQLWLIYLTEHSNFWIETVWWLKVTISHHVIQ